MKFKRIAVAAGGTFGHIRPALTLKKALEKLEYCVDFYCTRKDKQFKGVKNTKNVRIIYMKGMPRHKNPFKMFLFFSLLSLALLKVGISFMIRKPKMVIGCGGFVSFPILLWAYFLKIPYILLEQNSIPGLVSRLFIKNASHVFLSMPLATSFKYSNKNVSLVGNPIKIKICSRDEALKMLDFNKEKEFFNKKILAVIGGSLGALKINQWVIKQLEDLKNHDISCIMVTGKRNYSQFKNYSHKDLLIVPFIENIGAFYSLSDYIISRAGASSLSELVLFQKPTLLIPYPYASDNHQYINAQFASTQFPATILKEEALEDQTLSSVFSLLEKVSQKSFEKKPNNALDIIISYIKEVL